MDRRLGQTGGCIWLTFKKSSQRRKNGKGNGDAKHRVGESKCKSSYSAVFLQHRKLEPAQNCKPANQFCFFSAKKSCVLSRLSYVQMHILDSSFYGSGSLARGKSVRLLDFAFPREQTKLNRIVISFVRLVAPASPERRD